MTKSELKQLIKECVVETFNEIEAPWVSNPEGDPSFGGHSDEESDGDDGSDKIAKIFKSNDAIIPMERFFAIDTTDKWGNNIYDDNEDAFVELVDEIAEKYGYIYDKTIGKHGSYVVYDEDKIEAVIDPVLKRWVVKH